MTQARSPKPASADGALNISPDMFAMAAASPMRIAQSMTQEGMKFMARRLHAYADWADAFAASSTPQQWMETQNAFLARAQRDYAEESAALAATLASAASPEHASRASNP